SRSEVALLHDLDFDEGINKYGTLARAPLAGGAPRDVLEHVAWADWSADGTQLAVIVGGTGGDRLEYPIGTVLFQSTGSLSHMRISRDGKRLAFLDHEFRD